MQRLGELDSMERWAADFTRRYLDLAPIEQRLAARAAHAPGLTAA